MAAASAAAPSAVSLGGHPSAYLWVFACQLGASVSVPAQPDASFGRQSLHSEAFAVTALSFAPDFSVVSAAAAAVAPAYWTAVASADTAVVVVVAVECHAAVAASFPKGAAAAACYYGARAAAGSNQSLAVDDATPGRNAACRLQKTAWCLNAGAGAVETGPSEHSAIAAGSYGAETATFATAALDACA